MKRQALRSPALAARGCPRKATFGISPDFSGLSPTSRQIAHVLRTLTPLRLRNIATPQPAFDLHVLSTPPAFVLSQNQTLRYKNVSLKPADCLPAPAFHNLKTLSLNVLQQPKPRGAQTYRTFRLSKSSGLSPKIRPNQGDKKPEGRFSLHSAAQFSKLSCCELYRPSSTCQGPFSLTT